mmetsp:Transcript_6205/g.11065  ORF Transcript_6205/g.11065 Transcript_6205/m.11065 type:complete len:96 (-) Transcript_6205:1681-1968(-)
MASKTASEAVSKGGGQNLFKYLSSKVFGERTFKQRVDAYSLNFVNNPGKPLWHMFITAFVVGYAFEYSHIKHHVHEANEKREYIPPIPTEKDIQL